MASPLLGKSEKVGRGTPLTGPFQGDATPSEGMNFAPRRRLPIFRDKFLMISIVHYIDAAFWREFLFI